MSLFPSDKEDDLSIRPTEEKRREDTCSASHPSLLRVRHSNRARSEVGISASHARIECGLWRERGTRERKGGIESVEKTMLMEERVIEMIASPQPELIF